MIIKTFSREIIMEPLLHYKSELALRGRKVKDLARALGWEYGKVSRVLNGFQAVPADFDQRVRIVLREWDHKAVDLVRESEKVAAA
jgi:hypothetical protein